MSAADNLIKFGKGGEGLLIGLAAVAAVGLIFYVWKRGAGGVASDVASAAASTLSGAAVGTVKGLASGAGIPDTNTTQCQKDLAAGKYWDASFSCPAGEFVSGVFGARNPGQAPDLTSPTAANGYT